MILKPPCTAKIQRAADYYRHKYGRDPNLCLIHPSMLPSDEKMVPEQPAPELQAADGVRVRPYRPVLPGHLWIGIEDTL